MKHRFYLIIVKRFLDIFFAFIGILFLSPFYLIFMLINLIALGSPVFFVQERVGYRNKIFKLIKFKSMRNIQDNQNTADEFRLTKYGKFIRKTSIDELPELFNILTGKMSFVGPRPLLVEYLPLYNKTQLLRHNVLPGLTGLAQVNGRNLLSWHEKFEYDVYYAENVSFLLDCKIFFKTIFVVFKRKGISSSSSATMEKFNGNN